VMPDFAHFGRARAGTFSDADWVSLGSGIRGANPGVGILAVSGTNLYAAGQFDTAGQVTARCLAKWNGSAWSRLGSGIIDPYTTAWIGSLALMGSDLYVGGRFTNAGGVTVNNVAKWNGSAWSAVGGLNGHVSALAVIGTNLYASGEGQAVFKWTGSY